MKFPRKIEYKGTSFWLQSNGRYYSADRRKGRCERLLHRIIWIEENGPVPPGMEIHHKNGDWTDNSFPNMELISKSEHMRLHASIRLRDPHYYQMRMSQLALAREEAKKWHSSEDGHAWHVKQGRASFLKRDQIEKACVICASKFKTYWPIKAKYCCRKCAYEGQKNG